VGAVVVGPLKKKVEVRGGERIVLSAAVAPKRSIKGVGKYG
jgi:hypothetical protein